jgi:hypothetical protein
LTPYTPTPSFQVTLRLVSMSSGSDPISRFTSWECRVKQPLVPVSSASWHSANQPPGKSGCLTGCWRSIFASRSLNLSFATRSPGLFLPGLAA